MHINALALPTILLAGALFLIGRWAERKFADGSVRRLLITAAALFAVPGLLFVLYYLHLFDSAMWFCGMRAAPYTELLASGLGLAAGFAHSSFRPESIGEKLIAPALLTVLVLIPFSKPILEPLEFAALQDRCPDGVCLQSTQSTCGPASAATILRAFGKPASESEIAAEAFTYRGGTENWYLARVFRRRGLQARFVFQPPTSTSLPNPSIAGVVLPGGAGHFIAVLNQNSTEVTIGDPLRGRLVLQKADLHNRYRFTGFFLEITRRD